ncbi:MAG: serine/threonine-protein kinase [Bdellovibrionota bacterium]
MSIKPFLYGKYVILDRIAVGGMAEVFRAQTFGVHGFQRLLVIKRILPHLSKDEEFVDMFIDEAKIAVGLTHANICQVTDLGKIDDNYFIAMEYVNGKDLRAILKKCYAAKSPLGVEQSIYIASEMCKGLEHAHNRKDPITGQLMSVIHRDVSPQNVMISYHGEVKIVDFGIAKTEYKIHRTQAGVLKGKFAYMSPEQSMGQELNVQTDIFSAGIILFEMLTNQRLFLGGTDFETLENIKKCEVPSVREINPKVSPELEEIVYKALAKDQSERYQSASQMQNALSKVLYTEFPHFTQEHLSKKLVILFTDEMKKESENLKKAMDTIEAEQMESAQIAASVADHEISQKQTQRTEREKKPFFLIPWLIALWALIRRFQYPILFLLIAALPILFGKLFFGEDEPEPAKQEQTAQKTFVFDTTPPKCRISIDGEVKGETPLNIPLTLNQKYVLTLEKDGYQTIQQPILASADNTNFIFELIKNKPTVGAVKIESNPAGAKVLIDGQESGQFTPTIIDELPFEKEVEISLQKDGYKSYSKKLMIKETSQDLSVDLKKRGPTLKLNVVPNNAAIYLNKKSYGKTITDLTKNQTYTLRVEAKGYQPDERKIKIDGDQLELDIELKKKETQTGTISISATPWATVIVDGKIIGTSPILNYTIGVGKRTVIFRHPDFPDVTKTINIKFNEAHKLIVDLRQETDK